jgi:hypothetical protein
VDYAVRTTAPKIRIANRHRRLFSDGGPASNNGWHASSADGIFSTVYVDGALITIGSVPRYTRATLIAAIQAAPGHVLSAPFTGIRVTSPDSFNGVGAPLNTLRIEIVAFRVSVEIGFWGFDSLTFFNMQLLLPNTLVLDGGVCKTTICPTSVAPNPPGVSAVPPTLFMRTSHIFADELPASVVDAACANLKGGPSSGFYNSCRFDVAAVKNPNFANVIVASANAVVTLLASTGMVQNFTHLVGAVEVAPNGTVVSLPTVAVVPVNQDYPPVSTTTDDGGTGLPPDEGAASHLTVAWFVLGSMLFVRWM